jgi:hypothetical protein
MRRNALDDIAQIHERIDLQVLTRLHQGTQDGGSVRRRFAPREQPVFAAQHDRSECLLSPVVVDLEPSVFGVARQGDPVAQRVADGCSERALR